MDFSIDDNDDKALALLRQIAANTGGIDDLGAGGGPSTEINIEGQTADGRVGIVPLNSYVTIETDQLDDSNSDGSKTLSPGDRTAILDYRGSASTLYAIGATDAPGVEYELQVDGTTIGGRTNSPLGTVNDPFSFVNILGGVLPSEKRIRYVAHYDKGSTGDVDLAGRMHLEVL